ncbi:MAG TPA: serine/threonine-protein kinase [Polyangiaceae bacterium]|jgi:serine/threonine-protein kinase
MEPAFESPPILEEGQMLAGKYRILRLVGRGGMAEVYAARHEILHQTVAVKVLLPAVAAIPGAATRFLNEARSAARIRSEHVAQVMDVGMREDGSAYIVLEYLEGEELQRVIERRGPLPTSEAVDYVLQALEALAHAHVLGIVHRDLKPSNIFLSRGAGGATLVKVFDFGISKAPKTAEAVDDSSTVSQVILGTPSYMAPEQARSAKDVDARADIWALGVILYRLITGALPFVADTMADMLAAILVQGQRPMKALRPDVSPELESVVARCLAKERQLRFASVGELAQALAPHATAAGRMSLERISRTLGSGSSPGTLTPFESAKTAETSEPHAGRADAVAATRVEARTDSAWMEGSVAQATRASKRRLWISAGVAGTIALMGGALALRPAHTASLPSVATASKEPATPDPLVAATAPAPLPNHARVEEPAPTADAAPPPSPPAPSATAVGRASPFAPSSARPAHASGSASSAAPPTGSAHPFDILDQRN